VASKYYGNFEKITQILFFLLSTIFDDLSTIPIKLYNSDKVRLCLAGWLLTVAILINLYSALLSSEITVPTKNTKLENFSEIFCSSNQLQNYTNETNYLNAVSTSYLFGRTFYANKSLNAVHTQFWLTPIYNKEQGMSSTYKSYEEYEQNINPDCFSFLSETNSNFKHSGFYSNDPIKKGYMIPTQYKLLNIVLPVFNKFYMMNENIFVRWFQR